jgi:hypothetical protein
VVNLPLLLPLLVTAVLAIAGWYAVHRLSMNRDQENKRRDLRIQYLLEAYRRLEKASNRRDLAGYARELESALADIQLLGSVRQVTLAHEFAVSMAKNHTASLDPLIADIRSELRRELTLEPLTGRLVIFRHESRNGSEGAPQGKEEIVEYPLPPSAT